MTNLFARVRARAERRTSIGELTENARNGLAAAKRLGASLAKAPDNETAISVPEICAINFLLSFRREEIRRIAELGTFTGHTANVLAYLSHPDAKIEIYDLFEHNGTSRTQLRSHPEYDPTDFFAVWQHNTRNHETKFVVHRGDLNESAHIEKQPLDLLFIDIVKHPSIVNTVVDPFYDRLRVGGFLMHQDYYHWQSPWLVYQMELLSDSFTRLEDFGNNMTVYVKKRELKTAERRFDYVNGLDFSEKYRLMDTAIARHPGLRAGNLMASKLRLTLEDPAFDSNELQAKILAEFGENKRISRYAHQIMSHEAEIADTMW